MPKADEDEGLLTISASETKVPADAWELMSPLLTEPRRARMLAVASTRTRHIRLVLQDVHDPHNVSACLRSADAFGVQDCDVVTLRQSFRASTVARGVSPWLSVRRHQDVAQCVTALRAEGYQLFAGVPPRPGALPLHELPLSRKIAVVFGNEHAGIDSAWLPHIDQPFTIPMVGMVESLNISVGAAITLQHLTHRARLECPAYALAPAARAELLSTWICRQFPSWPEMLPKLRAKRGG